jgi:hypothetical protein
VSVQSQKIRVESDKCQTDDALEVNRLNRPGPLLLTGWGLGR